VSTGELLFDVEAFGAEIYKMEFKLDSMAQLCSPTYRE